MDESALLIGEYVQREMTRGMFVLLLSLDLQKIVDIVKKYGHEITKDDVLKIIPLLTTKDTDHLKSFANLKIVNNLLEQISIDSKHIMNQMVLDEKVVRI